MANKTCPVKNYRVPVPMRLPRYLAESLPRPIGPHLESLILNAREAQKLLDTVARDATVREPLRERARLMSQALRSGGAVE